MVFRIWRSNERNSLKIWNAYSGSPKATSSGKIIKEENYERVYQETEELLSKRQAYQQYDARLHEIAVDIRSYTKDLEEKRKERSRLETDRQLFVEMQKNLVTYQLHYDNMEYTKKALSASKGIPTLIVKHYLRDTESITNELLDIAYDGEVRVEPFDISADTPIHFPFLYGSMGHEDRM